MSRSEKTNLIPNNNNNNEKKAENEQQLNKYRNIVYYLTFVAYAMSHFSRKSYTNVKVQMKGQAGMDPILLSQMDTAFMFFYAIGSFFSGRLGDTFHAPTIIGFGLIGSAACVFFLVFGIYENYAQSTIAGFAYFYFLSVWTIHGLFQSTGGPVGTAIMGNWFDSKNRGWIFGTWTCHQYIGNIAAAVCASIILHTATVDWKWALVIPGLANLIWGLVCLHYLPERPEHVGIETEESAAKANSTTSSTTDSSSNLAPISFFDALRIPSVIGYALAFGFFKLINYSIFFWLPYFLATHFTPEQSNLISVLYDVGMMPGGIIVGTISDIYGGRRACVIVTFMMILIPLLWLFALYSTIMPAYVLLVLLGIMGVLVGGPNNIITSAVAADLAEHPSLRGNSRALGTVTGIINGSGSITAALGLMLIGPMQVAYGWSAVWYFLIACTIIGTLLMSPKVMKEIYSHDAPQHATQELPSTANRAGYQAIGTKEDKI